MLGSTIVERACCDGVCVVVYCTRCTASTATHFTAMRFSSKMSLFFCQGWCRF